MLFSTLLKYIACIFLLAGVVDTGAAQPPPQGPPPQAPPPQAPPPPAPGPPPRLTLPRDIVKVSAVEQETEGRIYKLHGMAEIETSESLIQANEIVYNEVTGEALAEGSVKYRI